MKRSKFLNLSFRDLAKGFFMAIIGAVLTGIYTLINEGAEINFQNIKPILLVGLASGIGYLMKNLFTNSNDIIFKKEKNETFK